MISIYTDGACSGNPGIGGWGVVILEPLKEPVYINGGEKDTTNIPPKSLHAGMPVTNGEKWIVNLWFRERLIY